MCCVYGPREVKRKSDTLYNRALVNVEFNLCDFARSEHKHFQKSDRKSRQYDQMLEQLFEWAILTHLYPRSSIDIYVQVLEDDGSVLATSINAITMALLNSGIPMRDFVCASSAAIIDEQIIVDLNQVELGARGPECLIAVYPKSGKYGIVQVESRLPLSDVPRLLKDAKSACELIYQRLDEIIREDSVQKMQSRAVNFNA